MSRYCCALVPYNLICRDIVAEAEAFYFAVKKVRPFDAMRSAIAKRKISAGIMMIARITQ